MGVNRRYKSAGRIPPTGDLHCEPSQVRLPIALCVEVLPSRLEWFGGCLSLSIEFRISCTLCSVHSVENAMQCLSSQTAVEEAVQT